MENSFDKWLDDFFGEIDPIINTVVGIIVLVVGIVLMVSAKKQSSKGKRAIAWICIVVGGLRALTSIVQLLFRWF